MEIELPFHIGDAICYPAIGSENRIAEVVGFEVAHHYDTVHSDYYTPPTKVYKGSTYKLTVRWLNSENTRVLDHVTFYDLNQLKNLQIVKRIGNVEKKKLEISLFSRKLLLCKKSK